MNAKYWNYIFESDGDIGPVRYCMDDMIEVLPEQRSVKNERIIYCSLPAHSTHFTQARRDTILKAKWLNLH